MFIKGVYMTAILSIDGGGIRGIIPITVLEYIENSTGKPASALFNFVAGTSTGGIIAAMLTVPGSGDAPKYSAADVKKLYIKLGGEVFEKSVLRSVTTLKGFAGPKYSALPLERLLKQYLGNAHISSALTDLIIPAYNIKSGTPWFFKSSFAARRKLTGDDPYMWQAARATSAAPTFFSPAGFSGGCFIDGGIFANNPALCAYAEAQRKRPQGDFFTVSLGTGENNQTYTCGQTKRWGLAKWLIPLTGMVMNASSATVDYQMKAITGKGNYFRLQLQLTDPGAQDMDNASPQNISHLEKLAHELIAQNKTEIDRVCKRLVSQG